MLGNAWRCGSSLCASLVKQQTQLGNISFLFSILVLRLPPDQTELSVAVKRC